MSQDVLNAAVLGSVYLLFALGMSLSWGTVGILNLAHGAIFMASAFVAYVISGIVVLPTPIYILIATATGAVLSTLTQLLVFQPILRRAKTHEAAEVQILIGGIGVASIPVAIAQIVTKGQPFGLNVSAREIIFNLGIVRLTGTALTILVLAVVISVATALWIKRSKNGLALRAIGVDSETASLMGVNKGSLSLGTLAVAGALAGLAGALLTIHLTSTTATGGDLFLIKAFAAIILGGVGSIAGVVVGSYALAVIETVVVLFGLGSWSDAASFAVIFVVLLLRPQGLFGRKEVRRA